MSRLDKTCALKSSFFAKSTATVLLISLNLLSTPSTSSFVAYSFNAFSRAVRSPCNAVFVAKSLAVNLFSTIVATAVSSTPRSRLLILSSTTDIVAYSFNAFSRAVRSPCNAVFVAKSLAVNLFSTMFATAVSSTPRSRLLILSSTTDIVAYSFNAFSRAVRSPCNAVFVAKSLAVNLFSTMFATAVSSTPSSRFAILLSTDDTVAKLRFSISATASAIAAVLAFAIFALTVSAVMKPLRFISSTAASRASALADVIALSNVLGIT